MGKLDLKSKNKTILLLHKVTETQMIIFNLQSQFHTSSSPNSIQVKSSGFQDLHRHNGYKTEKQKKNPKLVEIHKRNASTQNAPAFSCHTF